MKYTPLTAALLCSALPAWADITPQELLSGWQETMDQLGYDLTVGSQEQDGDTLVLRKVLFTTTQFNVTGQSGFEWMHLTVLDDGSVDISLSRESQSMSTVNIGDLAPQIITGTSILDGVAINASGNPDAIRYQYSIDHFSSSSFQLPNVDVPGMKMEMVMTGTQGFYLNETAPDGTLNFSGASSTDDFYMTMQQGGEYDDVAVNFTANIETFKMSFDMSVPADLNIVEMALTGLALPVGMTFGFDSEYDAMDLAIKVRQGENIEETDITQAAGKIGMSMGTNSLGYDMESYGTAINISGSGREVPPVQAAFSEVQIALIMPMRKSDTPLDFLLEMNLTGFTINDAVWDMFDPAKLFEHGPAGLSFGISGSILMLVDIFDQPAVANMRHAPAELRSLSLNWANVDFEGLGLEGSGSLAFDTGNVESAAGGLDFAVSGALGFLDKVGQLGLFDPMMVIGAKGALGMFGSPGDGPDTFTSHVEFTQGGHISVNGQMVK